MVDRKTQDNVVEDVLSMFVVEGVIFALVLITARSRVLKDGGTLTRVCRELKTVTLKWCN